MADPVVVCTIGYQGRTPQDFLDALIAASVDTLVDVRSRPISRKAGFSKRSLAAFLAAHGITYIHLPELGMPLDLLALRDFRDNTPILDAYRRQMDGRRAGIDRLMESASDAVVCLMCYEADPCQCHRGVIADHLIDERQLKVSHL